MALTLRGIDPAAKMKGADAWAKLQSSIGQPIDQYQGWAKNKINYTDPTGQAEISGSDFNVLQQEAANFFGGTFTPWAQPQQQQTTPTATPDLPWNANQGQWGQTLALPEAFKATGFRAPSWSEAQNDPGYQLALKESQNAIENSASARGAVFHPNTMRALVEDAQNRASSQYDKVYNREYDAWKEQFGQGKDVYDRSVDSGLLRDKAYKEDRAFDLGIAALNKDDKRWWADFQQRVNEFTNSDQFRRYVYGTDDEFRRWRATVGDAWQRTLLDEERARFLAELGTR